MVAFNFIKQFVPAVEDGTKPHTIRAERKDGKDHCQIGSSLQLYYGMKTKQCRKLFDTTCNRYEPIFITENSIYLNGRRLSMLEVDWLARNDGFDNTLHMMSWILKAHELPFKGSLIGWLPPANQNWAFHPLRQGAYGVILADPAWPYDTWGEVNLKDRPYPCMPLEQIAALPVGKLAAESCLLFMWTTWSHMDSAIAVMQSWGFKVATGGSWFKRTKHGKEHYGTGHILRSSCCEPFLIGTRGNPVIADSSMRNTIQTFENQNVIEATIREHSRKPDDVYEILDRLWPGAFRCELFARQKRQGWSVWGNQTEMFSGDQS